MLLPEDPLEEGMATHSSILAWKIPWTEEPGRLQSKWSQRVGHNLGHNMLPLQGGMGWILVRKLRSYMPLSLNKYINKRLKLLKEEKQMNKSQQSFSYLA